MTCPICHKECHDVQSKTCSVQCGKALLHRKTYLRRLAEMNAECRQRIEDEAKRRNVDVTLIVYEETREVKKPSDLIEKQKRRARLRARDEAYNALGIRLQTTVVRGIRIERRGTVPMGGRTLAARINNY